MESGASSAPSPPLAERPASPPLETPEGGAVSVAAAAQSSFAAAVASPPCGAAFLRRLHADPSATHVTLPTAGATPSERSAAPSLSVTPILAPSSQQTSPVEPVTDTFDPALAPTSVSVAREIEMIRAADSPTVSQEPNMQPNITRLPSRPAAVSSSRPAAVPLQQGKSRSSDAALPTGPQIPYLLPLDSPISPRSVTKPLSKSASGPVPTKAAVHPSAFQELVDAAPNGNGVTGSNGNDRASSFTATNDNPHELNAEAVTGTRTSWNDFAVAYCNGRFDPLRIPNPPDFDDHHAGPLSREGMLPNSAPSTASRPSRAYESQSSSSSPTSSDTATPTSGTRSRPKAFEAENLPNRPRQRPPKLTLPKYRVAAATVRIATSNLPDSIFAPLSVPSPERELLDPLASMMQPHPTGCKGSAVSDPGGSSSSTFVWNRSKSSVLPSGTPTHESLPTIPASPAATPGVLDRAPTSEKAWASACCGSISSSCDPPTAWSTATAKPPLPGTPLREEVMGGDDYFGRAPAHKDINEPSSPIPVPSPTDYPLVHHPHELRPFFEKYGFLPAPMPPREAERRKALYNFNILHTAGDLNFDRIVHMVKLVFNTRIVFLSLIDSDVQWYKSQTGFGGSQSARTTGFCGHTLLVDSDEPFVVLDTLNDWRFAKNPHVIGEPHIRFYAGTPLRTQDGLNLGSLCLVDDKPRTEFTPRSRHILKEFAAIVMREMELWRDKLQLRTRDKIQTSMENFTRECLEIDDKLSSTNFEAASRMGQVYQRAAKLVYQTLELDGCAILDISQFERVEVDLPDGTHKVVYHANPYHETQSVLERVQTFGAVPGFPVLASTPGEVRTRDLTAIEHERMSAFLGDQRDGRIFENIAPSWIRYIFPPSLKYGMVVPVIGIDGQPFALICAHTHDRGKQFLEGYELQFLRAIGVIILSAVLRRRMILADRSKSVLISSVSHELRTPLHGILAATELLNDSPLDTNQSAFLSTVKTCGLQLIETVNHVLDFTKLSSEKSNGGRRVAQLTQVDLADLVEQTVESCFVGQKSRFTQGGDDQLGSFYSPTPDLDSLNPLLSTESVVDIGLRPHGWNVMVDTGSLRRIVMNLYGNSLKFTNRGFVQVSLRELPHPPNATRVPVELTVVDTGKGIGKAFLKDQLFEPFTQENPLQPGTGLGLAIVNSIVRSDVVQGNVNVWSAEGVGTEIKVSFEVELAGDPEDMVHVPEYKIGTGLKVAFLGFNAEHRGLALVREVVTSYASFVGFETADDPDDADLIVVNEYVKPDTQKQFRNVPLILVASFKKSDPQMLSAMGRTSYTGLLYKPVGPAKVLKELKAAIKWLKHPSRANCGLSALTTSVSQLTIEETPKRPQPVRGMSTDSINSSISVNMEMPRPKAVSAVLDQRALLHRRRSDERGAAQAMKRPSLAPRGLTYHAVPTLSSPAEYSASSVSSTIGSETSSPASIGSRLSTISLADGGAMLKAAALPEVSGVGRRPARVLVVEDNVINRRVLTAFLKKRGYEHAEAVNGVAGVDVFGNTPPNHWDVILMDITMPIMNGYDATRSIRRIESTRRRGAADRLAQALKEGTAADEAQCRAQSLGQSAKIFALTGLATDDDKRQAFDSGVDGYLVKPVSLASLDLLFTKIGF